MHSDKVSYLNGQPTYTGDTVVKCFAGSHNGLLFRIVNNEEYKWAFYNDTTDYVFTVRVCFGGLSKVEPLQHTTMKRNFWTTEFELETTVAPGATEMFAEGEPNGFTISFMAQRRSKRTGQLTKPVTIEAPPPPPPPSPPVDEEHMFSSSEDDGDANWQRGGKHGGTAAIDTPF